MARVEESIEIQQPPETVYAFMADVNNLVKCSAAIAEVRGAPDRPVNDGDTYATVAHILGRSIETEHRVVSAVPPKLLKIEGQSGSMRLDVTIQFEPSEAGTRVTQVGEGEPKGALRFAGPMVERQVRQQIRGDLANLKRLLEAGG